MPRSRRSSASIGRRPRHPRHRRHPQDPLDDAKTRKARRRPRDLLYWRAKRDHIYLLTVYAKGVKDDLAASERDAWRKAVEAINND